MNEMYINWTVCHIFEDYLSSKVPMLIKFSGDISGLSDMGSLKNAGGLPHTSCLWSSDNLRTQPALPLGNCFLQVQRAHLWVSNSNDEMMSLVTWIYPCMLLPLCCLRIFAHWRRRRILQWFFKQIGRIGIPATNHVLQHIVFSGTAVKGVDQRAQ